MYGNLVGSWMRSSVAASVSSRGNFKGQEHHGLSRVTSPVSQLQYPRSFRGVVGGGALKSTYPSISQEAAAHRSVGSRLCSQLSQQLSAASSRLKKQEAGSYMPSLSLLPQCNRPQQQGAACCCSLRLPLSSLSLDNIASPWVHPERIGRGFSRPAHHTIRRQ